MADGSLRWDHLIDEGIFNYVLGAPLRRGNVVLALTQHGYVIALDAKRGVQRWRVKSGLQARTGIGEGGGQVFIGTIGGDVVAWTLAPGALGAAD